MVDFKKLARILAESELEHEEKISWLKAIPYMAEEQLKRLQDVLTDEIDRLRDLRYTYLEKAEVIIQSSQA